jgi:hypothetical protein
MDDLNFDLSHFRIDIPDGPNSNQSSDTENGILDYAVLLRDRGAVGGLFEDNSKVDGEELFWKGQDCGNGEHDDAHTACREHGGRNCEKINACSLMILSRLTMAWNCAQTSDQCNLESPISHNLCQTRIEDACPFQFLSASATAPFERAVGGLELVVNRKSGRTRNCRLLPGMSQQLRFQTRPTSPRPDRTEFLRFRVRITTAESVLKQNVREPTYRRKGDHKQDSDWNQPTKFETWQTGSA